MCLCFPEAWGHAKLSIITTRFVVGALGYLLSTWPLKEMKNKVNPCGMSAIPTWLIYSKNPGHQESRKLSWLAILHVLPHVNAGRPITCYMTLLGEDNWKFMPSFLDSSSLCAFSMCLFALLILIGILLLYKNKIEYNRFFWVL